MTRTITRDTKRFSFPRIKRQRAARTQPTLIEGLPDPAATPSSTTPKVPSRLRDNERVAALEERLGLKFNDSRLLTEALTHRSFLNEAGSRLPSNERLEFLGDAVLGLISTNFLFTRFPEAGEGELTNMRSALVRTETLARFAQQMDLGHYLFLGRGEEMSKGRRRPGGLACAFEALLGALYLDQGYQVAQQFALGFIEGELDAVIENRLHKNAKSTLQEMVQSQMQMTPTYHLVQESGPDHMKSFTVEVRLQDQVLGRGQDRSKRAAEQLAAEDALGRLRAEPAPQIGQA